MVRYRCHFDRFTHPRLQQLQNRYLLLSVFRFRNLCFTFEYREYVCRTWTFKLLDSCLSKLRINRTLTNFSCLDLCLDMKKKLDVSVWRDVVGLNMFSSLMVVVSDVYILNMNRIYFIFYFINCVVTVVGLANITRKKFVFCNILILTISVGVHIVILTQNKRGKSVIVCIKYIIGSVLPRSF